MPTRLLSVFALFMALSPVALAARAYSTPRPAVTGEPELVAALAAAVRDGLQATEYGSWELGPAVVVDDTWRIERSAGGVTTGRSKEVDVLARASAKNCYVVHLRVRQEFDGQSYVNAYRAYRTLAKVDGTEAERHFFDCAAFPAG